MNVGKRKEEDKTRQWFRKHEMNPDMHPNSTKPDILIDTPKNQNRIPNKRGEKWEEKSVREGRKKIERVKEIFRLGSWTLAVCAQEQSERFHSWKVYDRRYPMYHREM